MLVLIILAKSEHVLPSFVCPAKHVYIVKYKLLP